MTLISLSDSLSLLRVLSVSLIHSEEGSLQFNGGLFELLLPYEGFVDLIWIGYKLSGGMRVFWRAGYGPVFDSFFFQFTFE